MKDHYGYQSNLSFDHVLKEFNQVNVLLMDCPICRHIIFDEVFSHEAWGAGSIQVVTISSKGRALLESSDVPGFYLKIIFLPHKPIWSDTSLLFRPGFIYVWDVGEGTRDTIKSRLEKSRKRLCDFNEIYEGRFASDRNFKKIGV